MTNPMINPQSNYSGVTIQITNPAVNLGNGKGGCNPGALQGSPVQAYQDAPQGIYQVPQAQIGQNNQREIYGYTTNPQMAQQPNGFQAYPAQYYLNNYNYQANDKAHENIAADENEAGKTKTAENNLNQVSKEDLDAINKELENIKKPNSSTDTAQTTEADTDTTDGTALKHYDTGEDKNEKQDFSKSNGIINDLDARDAQLKADKKNSTQKRVVALTDDYIKSLENYLNNPNDEIRLMASKEILMRLDEDKERYNDAALNALLNKMLQDPSKLIRVAALSAFASQLASGNDYTVELLHNIQNNPSADKEDVLQAADILLKMSGGTEIKNIPNPAAKNDNSQEQIKGQ